MANVLTVPLSGNIYFDDGSQDTTIPGLTGSAVSLGFDGYAGLTVTGYNTDSSDRFTVEGASGSLFSVSDSLTGTIFSVNDAAGLPIIEVNSDATTDTIAIGEFGTNALFVSAGYVGVGTSTPTSTLDVSGDASIDGNILSGGVNLDTLFLTEGCQGTVTSVTGGNGLTGTITLSGSLNVGAGTGICVTADAVCVATACNTAWNAKTSCCGTVRCVNTGTGLTGGAITETGTISINSTCNACWNAKTTCIGTVTSVSGGDGLTGTVTTSGSLSVDSTVARTNINEVFSCNLTVQGDLTVTGDFTCLDTLVSITSAIEICNHGTGPALYAEQSGSNCVIACFVDSEGGTIVFDDGGNVGIGCATPGQKLTVVGTACITSNTDIDGNLTVDGNTTLGNAASDCVTFNACNLLANNGLPAGVDNSVLILDSDNSIRTDEIDSRVWGSTLVDGSGTANYIPIWSDGNTIGNSPLSSTGGLTTIGEAVAVNGNVNVKNGNAFNVYAAGNSIYTQEKTFTATVGTGGTTVATFAKSGLDTAKYTVSLINGVNKTAFEILVVYNGTTSAGTVYGIVDAQAASQLDAIDVSNSGSTIDLVITSASVSTTAIIQGKALY